MEQAIKDFIQLKRLAVVGVSHDARKFGNTIRRELKERGYRVFGVNSQRTEIEGEKCYPNISALKDEVDGIVVCVSPGRVGPILQEAADTGIRHVWLQQGAESPDATELARNLGLSLVAGKCILMYAEPVRSFHSVHRFFVGLFGKL